MLSSPLKVRAAVAAGAIAAVASTGAGTASADTPEDISHVSQWSHAQWTSPAWNTTAEYNLGDDDPAGGGPTRVAELKVTQSWCDTSRPTKVLVERELSASNPDALMINLPRRAAAWSLGFFELRGTTTRTPAGTGATCGTQSGEARVRDTVVYGIATATLQAAPGSAPIFYQRPEETGSFAYQDASATGAMFLFDRTGYQEFSADQSSGSWFWEGIWADATGVSITPGV